jgi:4-oxalocrotonate tautomerase
MPLVTVKAVAGRTVEQKRGLVKDITEAVVKNFNTTPDAVIVDIIEMGKEDFGKAGKLLIDS